MSQFEFEKLEDGNYEIVKYLGKKNNVTIPETHYGKKVTKIGRYAFLNKGIKKLKLSKNLIEIDVGAFQGNSLKFLYIPENVKSVGGCCFAHNKLKGIKMPESLNIFKYEVLGFNNFLYNGKLYAKIKKEDVKKEIFVEKFSNFWDGIRYYDSIVNTIGDFNGDFVICEIKPLGEIIPHYGSSGEYSTNKIKVVKQLTKSEVIATINKLEKNIIGEKEWY